MFDSLWPHGLQHARLPCPLSPGVCSNSYTLSQECHPTISSFVILFFSCPQSFLGSGSFLMSQLLASGSQSIRASDAASVLAVNIQSWLPCSACCLWDSEEFSSTPQFKSISSLALSLLYCPVLTSVYDYWKSHSFDYMDLCWQSDVNFQV